METFVHEFSSPINRYKAVCVLVGHRPVPVMTYEGRQCYVSGQTRVRGHQKGYGYHNVLHVHFLDDGSIRMVPAGKFNRAVKHVPLPN